MSPPTRSAPITPMLRMLAPSAVIPPSAKTNACTPSTTASVRHARHGPSMIAASAAPRKWPLVPPATGKLSIWAAKMNAAVTPSSGTRRSSRSVLAFLSPTPTATAAGTAHASATSVVRNPSGMCMAFLLACGADADDREVGEARAIAGLALDQLLGGLEPVRIERGVGAAALAGDVLDVRSGERVQAGSVAEMDVADEADPLERVEVAVHGGDVAAAGEFLGGPRARVRIEHREHLPAGGGDPQAGRAERVEGGVEIGRVQRRRVVRQRHGAQSSEGRSQLQAVRS